jgi:hypothetical protein
LGKKGRFPPCLLDPKKKKSRTKLAGLSALAVGGLKYMQKLYRREEGERRKETACVALPFLRIGGRRPQHRLAKGISQQGKKNGTVKKNEPAARAKISDMFPRCFLWEKRKEKRKNKNKKYTKKGFFERLFFYIFEMICVLWGFAVLPNHFTSPSSPSLWPRSE